MCEISLKEQVSVQNATFCQNIPAPILSFLPHVLI
eukprot:UN22570